MFVGMKVVCKRRKMMILIVNCEVSLFLEYL